MSDLIVQFDTVERFDVTFGLELFNSSITKLNANVVDHLIQASGVNSISSDSISRRRESMKDDSVTVRQFTSSMRSSRLICLIVTS